MEWGHVAPNDTRIGHRGRHGLGFSTYNRSNNRFVAAIKIDEEEANPLPHSRRLTARVDVLGSQHQAMEPALAKEMGAMSMATELRRAVVEAGDLAVIDMHQAEDFLRRALEVLDGRYHRRFTRAHVGLGAKGSPPRLDLGSGEGVLVESAPLGLPDPEEQARRLQHERRSQGQRHRHIVAGLRKELGEVQQALYAAQKELEGVKAKKGKPLGRVLPKPPKKK